MVGRWLIWLVMGHPVGLSLFLATALLSLSMPWAIGLAVLVDISLTALGGRLAPRSPRTLRRWHDQRTAGPGAGGVERLHRPSAAGMARAAGAASADRAPGSGQPTLLATAPAAETVGQVGPGNRPDSGGWVIGIWGGADAERFDRCSSCDGGDPGPGRGRCTAGERRVPAEQRSSRRWGFELTVAPIPRAGELETAYQPDEGGGVTPGIEQDERW